MSKPVYYSEDREAWAIDFNKPEGHSFAGVFWFDQRELMPHLDGCRIALFRTREQARTALIDVKRSHKRAVVRRVYITIISG